MAPAMSSGVVSQFGRSGSAMPSCSAVVLTQRRYPSLARHLSSEQVFDKVGTPMGFNNPNMPWWELEAALSDRPPEVRGKDGRNPGSPAWNAGGDGPAWSRKRQPYVAPDADLTKPLLRPDAPSVP